MGEIRLGGKAPRSGQPVERKELAGVTARRGQQESAG